MWGNWIGRLKLTTRNEKGLPSHDRRLSPSERSGASCEFVIQQLFVVERMSPDTDNPFTPPAAGTHEPVRFMPWRIVPAAASFLVGAASFGFGLLGVAVMAYSSWPEPTTDWLVLITARCSMFLGFGASWMVAGWYYWKRRYGHGLIANGVGVLITAIVFPIVRP